MRGALILSRGRTPLCSRISVEGGDMRQKTTGPDGGGLPVVMRGKRSPRQPPEGDGLDGEVGAVGNVPGVPPSERMRIGVAPGDRDAPPFH